MEQALALSRRRDLPATGVGVIELELQQHKVKDRIVQDPPTPIDRASCDHELAPEFARERERILADSNLNARQKRKLLESIRRAHVTALGGQVTNTESVLYVLFTLITATVAALSTLVAFAGLSANIAVPVIGSIVGGAVGAVAHRIGQS